MIASNSAIKIIFLATLAVACRANEESTILLRGNGNKGEPEAPGRELIEMDMNMGLGEMVCKERIPIDGSVVCQFRVVPPPDLTSSTIQHDCLYSSAMGSNFCLSANINRIRYNEVPDNAMTNPTVFSDLPPNTVTPAVLPVGQVGVSPSAVQNSPTFSPSGAPTALPSSSPTVSSAPTTSPSGAPTRDLVGMLQVFFFGDYGVDVNRNELGEVTPNVLAIDWLARDSNQDVEFDEKLVQRFALVTLDLSLQGARIANDAPRNAQLAVNECDWKGIVCNDNGMVEEINWSYEPKGRSGSGTISPEVRLLVGSLKKLDLSNNDLLGEIPEQLYKLTNLEKLFLFKNELEGTISSKIEDFQAITHFHLSHNNLVGSIPPNIKSSGDEIRPLSYLNLYSNKLTGTLPQNLRLRNLRYFDVGRNQLTGTLPDDIGEKFVWLRHFHLDHNGFGGTLPASYNTVGNGRLESFSINHNQLTGTIPGERTLYNKLVQYTLQSNNFEGMDKDTCKMEVPQGETVELRSDCSVCPCSGYFNLCELQCLE